MSETLVSLWTGVRRRLEAAGVDTPVLDARLLLETGAGVARLDIVTDPRRPMTAEQIAGVDALARRREAREPVSHILGRKPFWTFELAVTPDVLTPRPETEMVVEQALAGLPDDKPVRVLDLGVGSGAILLAILSERPLASGIGVDVSGDALAVARTNAERLGLSACAVFQHGNWCEGIDERFDAVVSNPPYIVSDEIANLAPEVARFEPRLALDGGADGLAAYRILFQHLAALLRPGGTFAFEVGKGQAGAVAHLAHAAGFSTGLRRDLAGVPRVVHGGAV